MKTGEAKFAVFDVRSDLSFPYLVELGSVNYGGLHNKLLPIQVIYKPPDPVGLAIEGWMSSPPKSPKF